jgi:alanine dehydrogenase
MRLLTAKDVEVVVPMERAIGVARRALEELSAGSIVAPLRPPFELPDGAITLVMPGHRPATRDLGVKIVSVHPRNPARGLPTVHAIVVVIDTTTGLPVGLIEGNALTALRTGAAVGAATDLLARPDARTLAVFGAGVQARAALRAICAVRQIEEIRLTSRSGVSAERLAAELMETSEVRSQESYERAGERAREGVGGEIPDTAHSPSHAPVLPPTHSPARIVVARLPGEAIRNADIIVTATTSATPVFAGAEVGPGVHVNAVGAFRPTERELDGDLVARARIVVDTREGCLAEAGDLLIPIAAGQLASQDVAELGEVGLGRQPGRTSAEQITVYKSVGHAALDVAMAGEAIRQAEALGLGQIVDL